MLRLDVDPTHRRRLCRRGPGPPRSRDRPPRRRRHEPGRRARRRPADRSATSPPCRSASTRRTAGCGSSRSPRMSATACAGSARARRSWRRPSSRSPSVSSLLTVVFTIFNAYVLRPFAVRDPGSLTRIGWRAHDDGGSEFRWRDYETLRERRDLFDAVVAEDTRFTASDGRTLLAGFVSDNYFEALAPRMRARPRARRRRRARAGGRAEPPGVDAAVRRRSRGARPRDRSRRPPRSRSSAWCGRSSPVSTTIRATCGSRCRPTPSW